MYLPAHFAQTEPAALHALMREHPLATVVSRTPDGLTADHLPLEFDATAGASGTLRGHVARANPLWQQAAGQAVLVVFQGAQAYVTPSAYPSKAATHKVVPTWNYGVVHAHGVLEVEQDPQRLLALVSRLTDHHEAPLAHPWAVGDAPPEFVQALLSAIVGIRIAVTRLEGKFKLSQNRSSADRAGVIDTLDGGDAQARALAALMRQV